MFRNLNTPAHNAPAEQPCTGTWSVLVETHDRLDTAAWERTTETTALIVLCWTCGARWNFTATTPATDDPDYAPACRDGSCTHDAWGTHSTEKVPDRHRPRIATSSDTTSSLAASRPEGRTASLRVVPERVRSIWTAGDDTYLWLIADATGNVLGQVAAGMGKRGAVIYSATANDDAEGNAVWRLDQPTRSLAAAVKALKAATT